MEYPIFHFFEMQTRWNMPCWMKAEFACVRVILLAQNVGKESGEVDKRKFFRVKRDNSAYENVTILKWSHWVFWKVLISQGRTKKLHGDASSWKIIAQRTSEKWTEYTILWAQIRIKCYVILKDGVGNKTKRNKASTSSQFIFG